MPIIALNARFAPSPPARNASISTRGVRWYRTLAEHPAYRAHVMVPVVFAELEGGLEYYLIRPSAPQTHRLLMEDTTPSRFGAFACT
jgi:hypothetical protein